MKYLLSIIFFCFSLQFVYTQKEDHIWLLGDEEFDIILPDRAADTSRGATNLDFNYDPVRIYYDPHRLWDLAGGNCSISDSIGGYYCSSYFAFSKEHGSKYVTKYDHID